MKRFSKCTVVAALLRLRIVHWVSEIMIRSHAYPAVLFETVVDCSRRETRTGSGEGLETTRTVVSSSWRSQKFTLKSSRIFHWFHFEPLYLPIYRVIRALQFYLRSGFSSAREPPRRSAEICMRTWTLRRNSKAVCPFPRCPQTRFLCSPQLARVAEVKQTRITRG